MLDLNDLRRLLPIPYVLEMAGCQPDSQTKDKLHYINPWRDDTVASLDVWLDPKTGWRWGDFADAERPGGSAIDVIQHLLGCDDKEAIDKAWSALTKYQTSDWTPPQIAPAARKQYDAASAQDKVDNGRTGALAALQGILQDWYREESHPALQGLNKELLCAEFRLSSTGATLLTPFYDMDDTLVGYTTQAPGGSKRNAPGMTMILYGAWRMQNDNRPVILCEGQSDTWAAHINIPHLLALGVPGAGQPPDRMADDLPFDNRTVYLCLDGDAAGRKAARVWQLYLRQRGCTVFNIPLPDGQDISDLFPDQVSALPDKGRASMDPPTQVRLLGGVYVKPAGDGMRPLSNWSLTLERCIVSDTGSVAYEGELLPLGRTVVLPAEVLATSARLVNWSIDQGVVWTGGGQDHLQLLQLLQHEAFFVAEGRMVNRVGYHDGDFVWHDGHIGGSDWTYVPPVSAIDLGRSLHIVQAEVNPTDVIGALWSMYDASVMEPLLAWLAIAPLRPLFDQFPSVFISGASGTGKTTMVELALRVFSGTSINTVLSGTTPYGVQAQFAASNAFPIWFDEYRNGARVDTRATLDQMLRHAYTGQLDIKGGQQADKSRVSFIPSDVPVIVTGEDSLVETSTTDRSIMLRLRKSAMGELDTVKSTDTRGFAHHYLTWLQDQRVRPVARPAGPADLNDRQRHNIGVLNLGWDLLRRYVREFSPEDTLGDMDLRLVIGQAEDAAETDPTWEAVLWALEQDLECVWSDQDFIYVSPQQLLIDITTKAGGTFNIPGSNAKALRADLVDTRSGSAERIRRPDGKRVHVVKIPVVN